LAGGIAASAASCRGAPAVSGLGVICWRSTHGGSGRLPGAPPMVNNPFTNWAGCKSRALRTSISPAL